MKLLTTVTFALLILVSPSSFARPCPQEVLEGMEQVLAQYTRVSDELAQGDPNKIQNPLRSMLMLFNAMEDGTRRFSETDCAGSIRGMKGSASRLLALKDLEAVRAEFKNLSSLLVAWGEVRGIGDRVLMYCPMVDVIWIQDDDDEARNPFLPDEMPYCGDEVRLPNPPPVDLKHPKVRIEPALELDLDGVL